VGKVKGTRTGLKELPSQKQQLVRKGERRKRQIQKKEGGGGPVYLAGGRDKDNGGENVNLGGRIRGEKTIRGQQVARKGQLGENCTMQDTP